MIKHAISYHQAVAAFHERLAQQDPRAIWQQPSRSSSKFAAGNWYFYSARGYLGRIGTREVSRY